jgi:hypothetical protein
MSVELFRHDGATFDFSNRGWFLILNFAVAKGFRWPMAGEGEEKDFVTDEEATALADAVERGIGDGTDAQVAECVSQELTQLLVTATASPMFSGEPIKVDARTIECWKQFIQFARSGGFSIDY